MYDDHYWMSHIGDPAFQYHVALTRIWGLIALRLAMQTFSPLTSASNASALEQFLRELEQQNKVELRSFPVKRLQRSNRPIRESGQPPA